jgi:hypothetical protein
MKIKIVLLTLVLSLPSLLRADIAEEKRQEIQTLLKLTGMEKMVGQMMTQVIASSKANMPQVPEAFWSKLGERINSKELIDQIMPVYDKYYSIEDLKAINAFYASPAGQRILATLPQVMQESMVIGQKWGQKLGAQVAAEAKAEIEATK